MRVLLLLLAISACEPARSTQVVSNCVFDVRTLPTVGARGKIGMGYFPAAGESLERPMAAHGARTNVMAFSSIQVDAADDVRSSAPEIAGFKLAAIAESSCQRQYLVSVTSGEPGTADLIFVDARGGEIDRAAIGVEPTTEIVLDRGWSGDGPTIAAGSLQGLHATTVGKSGVLVGTGAVRFSLLGALARFPDRDQQPPWWGGDSFTFTGSAGSGSAIAECDGARVEVPITVVDRLGDVTVRIAPGEKPLTRELFISAGDLYGVECDWDWQKGWLWVDGGWIGSAPETHYRFTVEKPGSYTASCTLPDGTTKQVDLVFE